MNFGSKTHIKIIRYENYVANPIHSDFNAQVADLLLISNRGSVDSLRHERNRETALHIAADAGFVNTCRVLLSHGAQVVVIF